MGKRRGAYRALVGKPERKRPVRKPRRRWKDKIKVYLREGNGDMSTNNVLIFPGKQ
jgi:hypothetical protein